MNSPADRLRHARIERGYDTAKEATDAFGWTYNTYAQNENGNAPFSYKAAKKYATALGVRLEWLWEGHGPMRGGAAPGFVRIIGRVGANPDGRVVLSDADESWDMTPLPPGAVDRVSALEVEGHSMRGFADDGSLIYFEDQRSPPTPDMLGHVVILETEDGQVLIKRLLRGDEKGRYDLESIAGPMMQNQRLRWAAYPSAIIPPQHARKIIMRASEAA